MKLSSPPLAAGLLAAFMTGAMPGPVWAHMPGSAHGTTSPRPATSPAQRNLMVGPAFDGLLRHDGGVFDRRQLAGKPTLIFFGYVSCSTVCPVALNAITLAMEELEKQYGREAVPNLLFVTTLPEQEGTSQVADFLQHFDARVIGLAAQTEPFSRDPEAFRKVQQIESLLNQFRIVRDDHHSPFAYVMDAGGLFVGRPLNTQNSPEELARSLAAILNLKPRPAVSPTP